MECELLYSLRYSSWREGRERRAKLPITSSLWTRQTCLGEATAILGNCGTSALPGREGGARKSSEISEYLALQAQPQASLCPALKGQTGLSWPKVSSTGPA